MIEPGEIETMLRAAFPDGRFQVKDLTGTKDHYEALIVTQAFEGKGLIEQHRLVYAALGDAMRERIHALTLKTFTPETYSQKHP
jgi:stress-induced morphogen